MILTERDSPIINLLQQQDFCFYKDISNNFFFSSARDSLRLKKQDLITVEPIYQTLTKPWIKPLCFLLKTIKMTLRNKKMTTPCQKTNDLFIKKLFIKTGTLLKKSQEVSQKRCGHALKSLKGLWIQSCSQAGHGLKGVKWGFYISAHPQDLIFKRIYGVSGFKESGVTSSRKMTTLTHPCARVVIFREDVKIVSI